jgi:glucose-1-phosphate adenylyltransferase
MYYESSCMLVLSGDHLYRMNYDEIIRFHRERQADITISVYPVGREEASQMGLLRVDRAGKVEEFLEKPQDNATIAHFNAPESLFTARHLSVDSECCLASMGIYVFNPEVLQEALNDSSQTDFGREIIPAAIEKYDVYAYPFIGYWKDIGTITAFFDVHLSLTHRDPPFELYRPAWPLYTHSRSLPPCSIIRSEIRDSLIVEGSDVQGARISDSIIGMRSNVRDGANLNEVVMLGADFFEGDKVFRSGERKEKELPSLGIGRDCTIERAILDKNVRIGDGVRIKSKNGAEDYRGSMYWIRDGITIVPKGVIIPPGTTI